MNLPIIRHSDTRRELIEWACGPFRACKVLTARADCEVGSHYHKKKDEIFYLLSGSGEVTLNGVTSALNHQQAVFVERGVAHSFRLSEGSVLLGAGTERFDPLDDYHEAE